MGDDAGHRRDDRAIGQLQFRRPGVRRGLLAPTPGRQHLGLRRPAACACAPPTVCRLASSFAWAEWNVRGRRLDLLAGDRARD